MLIYHLYVPSLSTCLPLCIVGGINSLEVGFTTLKLILLFHREESIEHHVGCTVKFFNCELLGSAII